MNFRLSNVIGLIIVLLVTSCTSLRALEAPNPQTLKVGDIVEVVTNSGEQCKFRIVELNDIEMTSEDGQKFTYKDISDIDVRRISPLKTAAAMIVTGGLMALIVTEAGAGLASLIAPPMP